MDQRTTTVLVATVLAVIGFWAGSVKHSEAQAAPGNPNARYAISQQSGDRPWLLDSVTGETWHLREVTGQSGSRYRWEMVVAGGPADRGQR